MAKAASSMRFRQLPIAVYAFVLSFFCISCTFMYFMYCMYLMYNMHVMYVMYFPARRLARTDRLRYSTFRPQAHGGILGIEVTRTRREAIGAE